MNQFQFSYQIEFFKKSFNHYKYFFNDHENRCNIFVD